MLKENDRIVMLGGTGQLGSVLQTFYGNKYEFVQLGRKEYNAHIPICSDSINKIFDKAKYCLDFTRNSQKSLLTFSQLINTLASDITYVNISTYNLNHPIDFPNEQEYLFVKSFIEKHCRPKIDYNIRVPWVIDTITSSDLIDIAGQYIYTVSHKSFADQLVYILQTHGPGTYNIQPTKHNRNDIR